MIEFTLIHLMVFILVFLTGISIGIGIGMAIAGAIVKRKVNAFKRRVATPPEELGDMLQEITQDNE